MKNFWTIVGFMALVGLSSAIFTPSLEHLAMHADGYDTAKTTDDEAFTTADDYTTDEEAPPSPFKKEDGEEGKLNTKLEGIHGSVAKLNEEIAATQSKLQEVHKKIYHPELTPEFHRDVSPMIKRLMSRIHTTLGRYNAAYKTPSHAHCLDLLHRIVTMKGKIPYTTWVTTFRSWRSMCRGRPEWAHIINYHEAHLTQQKAAAAQQPNIAIPNWHPDYKPAEMGVSREKCRKVLAMLTANRHRLSKSIRKDLWKRWEMHCMKKPLTHEDHVRAHKDYLRRWRKKKQRHSAHKALKQWGRKLARGNYTNWKKHRSCHYTCRKWNRRSRTFQRRFKLCLRRCHGKDRKSAAKPGRQGTSKFRCLKGHRGRLCRLYKRGGFRCHRGYRGAKCRLRLRRSMHCAGGRAGRHCRHRRLRRRQRLVKNRKLHRRRRMHRMRQRYAAQLRRCGTGPRARLCRKMVRRRFRRRAVRRFGRRGRARLFARRGRHRKGGRGSRRARLLRLKRMRAMRRKRTRGRRSRRSRLRRKIARRNARIARLRRRNKRMRRRKRTPRRRRRIRRVRRVRRTFKGLNHMSRRNRRKAVRIAKRKLIRMRVSPRRRRRVLKLVKRSIRNPRRTPRRGRNAKLVRASARAIRRSVGRKRINRAARRPKTRRTTRRRPTTRRPTSRRRPTRGRRYPSRRGRSPARRPRTSRGRRNMYRRRR